MMWKVCSTVVRMPKETILLGLGPGPRPGQMPRILAIQAIEAMQSIADQMATLPNLLTDIERAIESADIFAQSDLLSLRLRKLDDSVEVGMESLRSIVQRLRIVVH